MKQTLLASEAPLQWNNPSTSWCDSYNRFKTLNVTCIAHLTITTESQLEEIMSYRDFKTQWICNLPREQQEYILLLMAAVSGEI